MQVFDSSPPRDESQANHYARRANTHALERYRLECIHWLRDRSRVLDVGCGTGGLLAQLRPGFQVFGIDLSPAMLSAGAARGHIAVSMAEHLPFDSSTFDGGVTINLLEHVSDPGRVLQEMARVLQAGGRVLVTTPAAEWSSWLELAERLALKIPEGPHRFVTRAELLQFADRAGLQTVIYRRILSLPMGGRRWARAGRFVERWTPQIGALHLLVADKVENR